MIDHVSIPVRELARAAQFYESILAPLGLVRMVDREGTVGFGRRYPEFWLNLREQNLAQLDSGHHVCLRAPNEDAVRAFFALALANGGANAGEPGPREGAVTTYFGAFILDLDGNKVEAATFPGGKQRA